MDYSSEHASIDSIDPKNQESVNVAKEVELDAVEELLKDDYAKIDTMWIKCYDKLNDAKTDYNYFSNGLSSQIETYMSSEMKTKTQIEEEINNIGLNLQKILDESSIF